MTEFILKAHNYAEYKLCCRCFSRNFSKIFRTVILKEDLPKDVPYIIEDHLWMSASNETTPQKNVGGSKPSQSRIQAVCETGSGAFTLAPKKHSKVSFSSCFPTRKCWIAITDFTIYLIISKFFRRQKCRQKRKTKTKGRWSEGRNYPRKCFHSSNYVIDHANVHFFFLISLLTRSHLLNDVLSLHCVIWFLPDYLMHLFTSDSFIALTSM